MQWVECAKGPARIILTVFVLQAGCAPMAEIDIRVMDPAAVTLPLSVQNLAFMNRTVYPGLLYPDTARWTAEEIYVLDTLMNNWIFKGIRKSMDVSPLYDMASIRIIKSRRSDTSGVFTSMDTNTLRQVKTIYPSDAVISLEYYMIRDSLRVVRNFEQGFYEAYMGISVITLWRIYDLNKDIVIDEIALRETTDWVADGQSVESSVDGLPLAIEAIRQAAFNAGMNYGERISPTWKETQRFFHSSGGIDIRKAAGMVHSGDWHGAAELWRKLAYGEHRKTAARACFNMALFCEMEDELIRALDWAVKSYAIKQVELTKEYIDLLRQRYSDLRRLNNQLPDNSEFPPDT